MSVRPDAWPGGLFAGTPPNSVAPGLSLSGAEGQLLAIRISIEARLLEKLLDSLASLAFPINPQIYHHAALVYIHPDGRQIVQPTTTVEFPAYAGRLPEVRTALKEAGFEPASLAVKNILEEMTCDVDVAPAPAGSPYQTVIWYRYAPGSTIGAAPEALLSGANPGSR